MKEEEFHRYMSERHAPLVREALARHGITGYTMVNIIPQMPARARVMSTFLVIDH